MRIIYELAVQFDDKENTNYFSYDRELLTLKVAQIIIANPKSIITSASRYNQEDYIRDVNKVAPWEWSDSIWIK